MDRSDSLLRDDSVGWCGIGEEIFFFHPYLGKISNLTNIFQMGWNHQPDEWLVFYDQCR